MKNQFHSNEDWNFKINVFLISMFTFINFSLHLLGKHANNSIKLEDEFDLFKSCCCLKRFQNPKKS